MYLSRMELNIKERNTMKALVSPNLFHGAIEDAFPGPRERKRCVPKGLPYSSRAISAISWARS